MTTTALDTTSPDEMMAKTTSLGGTMVKIQPTGDGTEPIVCPYEYVAMSVTIKNMIDDLGGDLTTALPLHVVNTREMKRVLEWCKHRFERPVDDKDKHMEKYRNLSSWEKEYTEKMDQPATFQLILAANYLDIRPLLDLLCKSVALNLSRKTPEQIKEYFGITREFTPEEMTNVMKDRGLIPQEN